MRKESNENDHETDYASEGEVASKPKTKIVTKKKVIETIKVRPPPPSQEKEVSESDYESEGELPPDPKKQLATKKAGKPVKEPPVVVPPMAKEPNPLITKKKKRNQDTEELPHHMG